MSDLYPDVSLRYPLPYTGKTDTAHLLKAFYDGGDGVCIAGCSLGNCHHVRGNERGLARVGRAKQLLDEIGLGGERLEMFFVSGGMGATFARHAEETTERIRDLQPNPLRLRKGDKRAELR